MKIFFINIFICLFWLVISVGNFAFADSPVTSTDFYKAYTDIEMVNYAQSKGIIDNKIAQYLHNPSNSIDKKAAAINALSWSIDGKNNAILYKNYLYKIKAIFKNKALGNSEPIGSDKFCIAYLSLLDDYNNPSPSINLLKEVSSEIKNSYTVNVILMIAKAQENLFNGNANKVKSYIQELQSNDKLKQDLRPEAKQIIFDYMNLY